MANLHRYLAVGIETVFGSLHAKDKYIRVESEGLKEEAILTPHETVAYDSPDMHYVTARKVKGDVVWAPCPDEIGEFLYCMFGSYTYTGAGTYDTHVFDNGTTDNTPASLSIHVRRDTSKEGVYTGCKHSLELSMEAGKPLIVTASVVGQDQQTVVGAGSAPTFMADKPFLFTSGTVLVNGVDTKTVKACNIKIDNNYDEDGYFCLGTAGPREFIRQAFSVTGGVTLSVPDTNIYGTHYRQGSAGSLHVTCSAKTSGGTTRALNIRIPKLQWTEAEEGNLTKRDQNVAEYSFEANYSTGSVYTCLISLTNNHGTSYPNV